MLLGWSGSGRGVFGGLEVDEKECRERSCSWGEVVEAGGGVCLGGNGCEGGANGRGSGEVGLLYLGAGNETCGECCRSASNIVRAL